MLADQFFPSLEELNSKPHLAKYLEELKALQEKFLEEHPEEHPERVRLLGCGVLGEPFIPLVKKVFIPPKKNRTTNIWNAHLRSSYAKGLKLKDAVDCQVITQQFADIKSGQAPSLSELDENARAFNSTIRAQNDTSDHLKYHISKLAEYCQHLKQEYNCHLVIIHSTCRHGYPDDYGCYANSGECI